MKVFVSGCFDLLHSGHIQFFKEASKYGDLYVGIGNDKNLIQLKGKIPINKQDERLFIVKSIKYVKDAFINSGYGLIDFENEIDIIKPDIFIVNNDGYNIQKEIFCNKRNIKFIVLDRIPYYNLPQRSSTNIRNNSDFPYRIELCGGWLDQPILNKILDGTVITISIHPTYNFNIRSGMATSSRNKAIEIWNNNFPLGNYENNAKILFSVENPPGSKHISGSQDQLGIMLPGINNLYYNNSYWPEKIESIFEKDIIDFIENNICLVQLPLRKDNFNIFENKNININSILKLKKSSELCWKSIKNKNIFDLGKSLIECFESQIEIFPNTITNEVMDTIQKYKKDIYGYKLTGCGGCGYLILVTHKKIKESIKIKIRI